MAKEKEIVVSKGNLERMPRAFPFGRLDRMFDDFLGPRWARPFGWDRPLAELTVAGPNVDIIDRDEEVLVRVEVPGFRKEDIDVSVADGYLTLKGEAHHEEKEEKGDYFRNEISHEAFSRVLPLPAGVDDTKARASMRDGVLELTLPKREKSRRHSIAIA